jgi:hypothetical protein
MRVGAAVVTGEQLLVGADPPDGEGHDRLGRCQRASPPAGEQIVSIGYLVQLASKPVTFVRVP